MKTLQDKTALVAGASSGIGRAAALAFAEAGAAVVVGLAAMELESRIEGSRLGVVRRATSLSSDPALGMDRGPSLGTGEIVRVLGRRGGWTRVEATADREGWIASSELFPLDSRRPPR